jgi:hypothetical protein
LTSEEIETLQRWARRPPTAQALAERARIVLACASGKDNGVVAAEARVTRQTVGRWRRRFLEKRVEGLLDERAQARRARSRMNTWNGWCD